MENSIKYAAVDYLRLLRVKHYIKNFLIFLPLFFSRNFLNFPLLMRTIAACLVFCFSSSCIYILNDIKDVEKDKQHPTKCKRPIASGRITIHNALVVAAFIFALTLLVAFVAHIPLSAMKFLLLYLVLNALYSCGLKNVALADIAILASGFVLRVIYGSKVTSIAISDWMYLTIMMASLYAAFGKRRNELAVNGGGGT